MARTVLKYPRFLVAFLAFVAACFGRAVEGSGYQAPPNHSSARDCIPAESQDEVRQFQKSVESGPLYVEMVRQLGKPGNCKTGIEEENIELSCAYGDQTRLEAHANSKIEFSEQRLQLSGLSKNKALALLKASEKDAFGADGCGVRWNHPVVEAGKKAASREVVYRGSICNCQGRMIYEGVRIVALVWRSTC